MSLRVSIETITPEKAQKMWESNLPRNRYFRKTLALGYSAQMKAGKWDDNTGEPVQFDVDNHLVNGQHRIWAIIDSKTTHTMVIVRGVPKESFANMDIGLKRTGGDILHIEGARQAIQMSGIIRKYLTLKKNYFGLTGGSRSREISNEMVLKEFRKRKGFWNDLNDQATEWYREFNRFMSPSDIGGFYAYFNDKDEEAASRFFIRLCTGVDLGSGSAIRHLRNFLIKTKGERNTISKLRSAYIIKAWNLSKSRQSVDRLSFNPEKEEFPVAI